MAGVERQNDAFRRVSRGREHLVDFERSEKMYLVIRDQLQSWTQNYSTVVIYMFLGYYMTMLLKKSFLSFMLVCIIISPFSVSAQSNSYTQSERVRIQLLTQIEKLLKEVVRLQTQLERQSSRREKTPSTSVSGPSDNTYKSKFFSFPFEEIYFLNNVSIFNSDGTSSIRKTDKQLFDLFVSVVGENVVRKYVKEWRIFNDSDADVGAFVELMSTGRDEWIVGVNRSNFTSNEKHVRKSFADLFIHEYSHILLYEQSDFVERFEARFWTEEDYRHKKNVERASSANRFKVMDRYYDRNKNRFVGDYSTVNPDEDMAESFVFFVREDILTGNTIRDKKILSFYQEEVFIEARTKIRSNLVKVGL